MKRTPLKRKTRLTSTAKPKPRKRIKAKPRTGIEFARVYGSKRRVEFIKNLHCIVCFALPSENAHITSGGMGRKADYTQIVPLCASCHRKQHDKGWSALGWDEAHLQYAAAKIQHHWATRVED